MVVIPPRSTAVRSGEPGSPTQRDRHLAIIGEQGPRGHSYGRALRGVADRLLGVTCALLKRQTLFDPAHGTTVDP